VLNYYDFLKIPESASQEEIELAFAEFKKELLKFSPGINISDNDLRSRKPKEWDAYQILLNPILKKEYDEAHEAHRQIKLSEEENKVLQHDDLKSSVKWKYLAVGAVVILSLYFIFRNGPERITNEEPKWRTHYLTDEIQVVLPAAIDTNVNIIPPFLFNFIKSYSCCQSELKGGFSVTTARFTMQDSYKISESDISYINNTEMGNHMAVHKTDSAKFTMNIRGYRVFVRKGTYDREGISRAFENYSMLKGNTAIKIIIAYVPGDAQQMKYAETVFNSLNCF
jgi:hypothetical protein